MKIPFTLPLLLLLLAPASLARAAEPPSVEDRLRALEAKVGVLEQENAALRRQLTLSPVEGLAVSNVERLAVSPVARPTEPAPTVPPPARAEPAPARVVPMPAGQETRLVIGGFTQIDAEFGGLGDTRFTGAGDRIYVRRSRLSLRGSFAEHFEFRVDGEFGAGTVAPGTGLRASSGEIMLGWNRYPAATLRLGQLKPAFGAELLTPSSRGVLVERSFGTERVGDGRQVGATVNGDFFGQRLGYLAFVGNGTGSNTSANDNRKFLQTAHAYAIPFDSTAAGKLTLGIGALHSTDAAVAKLGPGFDAVAGGAIDNLFAGTRDGWGLDAAWHFGLLDLSSELLRVRYRPLNAIPDRSFSSESWQFTAAYYVIPRRLQAIVRREHFDPNSSRRGDATENWTTGLTYFLKGEDLRLMVNYLFGHPAGFTSDEGRLLTRFQIVY